MLNESNGRVYSAAFTPSPDYLEEDGGKGTGIGTGAGTGTGAAGVGTEVGGAAIFGGRDVPDPDSFSRNLSLTHFPRFPNSFMFRESGFCENLSARVEQSAKANCKGHTNKIIIETKIFFNMPPSVFILRFWPRSQV